MDYCDIDYLEQYGGFTSASEPERAMLTVHISQASAMIDAHCGRKLRHPGRGGGADPDVHQGLNGLLDPYYGRTLWLDEDLYSTHDRYAEAPAAVLTWIPADTALLRHHQGRTACGRTRRPSTGFWAYSKTPPATIVNTTARLAMWLYHQRESGDVGGQHGQRPERHPGRHQGGAGALQESAAAMSLRDIYFKISEMAGRHRRRPATWTRSSWPSGPTTARCG